MKGQISLFPGLVDRPRYGGFASDAGQLAEERELRRWWAQWEREHPPPRVCACGEPGGTLWLTFLDERGGPRPYHPECTRRPA